MAASRKVTQLPKIEKQMELLKKHFADLQKPRSGFELPNENLADQWLLLEQHDQRLTLAASIPQQENDEGRLVLRGRTYKKRPPLAELFNYIEAGTYPPPELLLALLDVWYAYLKAGGLMELEDAFFEKPVQKSGNYAKRAAKQRKNIGMGIRAQHYLDQGTTKTKAFEQLAADVGGDADTLKRTVKPISPRDIHEKEK